MNLGVTLQNDIFICLHFKYLYYNSSGKFKLLLIITPYLYEMLSFYVKLPYLRMLKIFYKVGQFVGEYKILMLSKFIKSLQAKCKQLNRLILSNSLSEIKSYFGMQSSKYLKKTSKRTKTSSNGRWTKTEHDRFMKALEKYGKNWLLVQKYVATRTLTQVRSHAQKVFMRMSNQDDMFSNFDSQLNSDYENIHVPIAKSNTSPALKSKNQNMSLKREDEANDKRVESLLDIFKKAIQAQSMQLCIDQQAIKIQKQQNSQLGSLQMLPIAHPYQNISQNSQYFPEMCIKQNGDGIAVEQLQKQKCQTQQKQDKSSICMQGLHTMNTFTN